ncbi:phosphatase PAP2 family protein [Mesorhizobium sp. M0138]|uniref:phosphatase PAP2 family protein n=2 Tax=Mesorhizobium TaxID=68287 RepID=UPI00333A6591
MRDCERRCRWVRHRCPILDVYPTGSGRARRSGPSEERPAKEANMAASADLTSAPTIGLSAKLAIFGLCYAGVAAGLFPETYLAALGTRRLLILYFLLPFIILLGIGIAAPFRDRRAPATWFLAKISSRWRGATLTLGIFILCLAAFTTYKYELAQMVPFFADRQLAEIDAALHFGHVWNWARSVPLPGVVDQILYVLYAQLWFVAVAFVVVSAAWMDDAAKRQRYFLSLSATAVILGIFVRIIGSSAGPIFYDRLFDPDLFDDLTASLRSSNAGPAILRISDYLYSSYTSRQASIGTGISAMPSFHVAVVTLNALLLSSINRTAGIFAWLYVAAIMFGSVYFGWHYAIDGYVSIILVWLIWRATGKLTGAKQ